MDLHQAGKAQDESRRFVGVEAGDVIAQVTGIDHCRSRRPRRLPHSGTVNEGSGGAVPLVRVDGIGREAAEQEGPQGELANPRIWGFGAKPRDAAWRPQTSGAADIPGMTYAGTPADGMQTAAEREDGQGCPEWGLG